MSSLLCCLCHRSLPRGGMTLGTNYYTASLNDSKTSNPNLPFTQPMEAGGGTKLSSPVTEMGSWESYIPIEAPILGAISDFDLSWSHLLGTELILPSSYPPSLPLMSLTGDYPTSLELGTDMGAGVLSAAGGCFLESNSTSACTFGTIAPQYYDSAPPLNAASSPFSSLSPSMTLPSPIYAASTTTSTSWTRTPANVPPAGLSPVSYPCLEKGCEKAFKKLCSLKYVLAPFYIHSRVKHYPLLCFWKFLKPQPLREKPCQSHTNLPTRFRRQHERTHTRPEVCRHCVRDDGTPMRFASKKCLGRHMVSKHPETVGADDEKNRYVSCPFFGCRYKLSRG